MELNFLNSFSKEFTLETNQIKSWINNLLEIKKEIKTIKSSTENETNIYENFGKNLLNTYNFYIKNVEIYKDDPSQLYSISRIFSNLIENKGKLFSNDMNILNFLSQKYNQSINYEIENLICNITKNTTFYMEELCNTKKNYFIIQRKYLKLKSDIEDAHKIKKKSENDPKLIYNISLKTKAEEKILVLLKEMQIVIPELNDSTKDVANKENSFNKLMKESFELVITCVFKQNVKIREILFLLSKEKEDIFLKLKSRSKEKFEKIKSTIIQLNDFTERKYAEMRSIYFESLETINIFEHDSFGNSLVNITESLENYANNFYNLMKKRKRILKEFHKFVINFTKKIEDFSIAFIKLKKKFLILNDDKKFFNTTIKKNYDTFFQIYENNINNYAQLIKYLSSFGIDFILKIANEIKFEYVKFIENWRKFAKKINSNKSQLLKIQNSRNKISEQVNEINRNLEPIGINDNNFEVKLKMKLQYYKEDLVNLRENSSAFLDKYSEIIIQALDFLKNSSKKIREIESKKLKDFVGLLEKIEENFYNIWDQNTISLSSIVEMTLDNDFYQETKEIFADYLEKYNLSEKYFESIIKKILRNTSFGSDEFSKERLNDYLIKKDKIYSSTTKLNNININNNDLLKKFSNSDNNENLYLNNFNFEKKIFFQENDIDSYYSVRKNEEEYPSHKKNVNFSNKENNNHNLNNKNIDISPLELLSNEQKLNENLYSNKNSMKYKIDLENENNILIKHINEKSDLSLEFNDNNDDMKENDINNINNFPMEKNNENHDVSVIEKNAENLINQEDKSSFTDSLIPNSYNSSEEKELNFIQMENFKEIGKEGTLNIRDNEIEEYMQKLKNFKGHENKNQENKVGYFKLEENEIYLETYNCAYVDKILLQGKLYITSKKIAFRSLFNNKTFFGVTKLVIPFEEIKKVEKKINLKIFDNSLEITTSKTKLFFTSFIFRDNCYNKIMDLTKNIKKDNPESQEIEDIPIEENDKTNKKINRKNNIVNKILKKIDFFNKLDKIHNENYLKFEETNKYKNLDFYTLKYFNQEYFGNYSLPIIFHNIYNPDNICEKLNYNKNFWESFFLSRNDKDINLEKLKSDNVPKFYNDLDYMISKLSNFDEEQLNEFLSDSENWPTEPFRYTFKCIHPIEKKMFGPEKINLTTEYNIYLVSPKLFIVEEISNSTGFTYCDYFISMQQWRFYCDYKFDSRENVFKFNTKITVGFQTHFFKTCMFKNLIEAESAKESEEHIRFSVYDKMKFVLDAEMITFNEILKKITEENIEMLNYTNLEEEDFEEIVENDNKEEENVDEENINFDKNKENVVVEERKNESGKEIEIFEFFGIWKIEKEKFYKGIICFVLGFIVLVNLKGIIFDKNFSMDKVNNSLLLIIVMFFVCKN